MHQSGTPKPGCYYKDKKTGEIIYVVAASINHFHNSKVIVYESSFAPGEYHYLPAGHKAWRRFISCKKKDLVKWFNNYKYNYYKTPIFEEVNKVSKKKDIQTLIDEKVGGDIIEEGETHIIFETDQAFDGAAIFCKQCGRSSYNHNDVKCRYCNNCDLFHNPFTKKRG